MNQNTAFSNESKWLHDKKLKLIEDLLGFETQSHNLQAKLVQQIQNIKKQLSETKHQKQQEHQKHCQQINNINVRIKQLEEIIKAKEDLLIITKKQNQQLCEQLAQLKKTHKALQTQIDNKQKQLINLKLTTERQKEQLESQHIISKRKQENDIKTVIDQYQRKIEQKVIELQLHYQKEISQIKEKNIQLIQKLEMETKNAMVFKENENIKNQTESQKLLIENKKLYGQINEYKMKMLDLQTTKQSLEQQLKLYEKQKQYHILNLKRENSLLKDDKLRVQARNKKLLDEIDQLNWNIKQVKILQQKQLKLHKQTLSAQYKQEYEKQTKHMIDADIKYSKLKQQYQKLQEQNHNLKRQKNTIQCDLQFQKTRIKNIERQNISKFNILEENGQYQKQLAKKQSELESLQQQIKKLKIKIAKINTAYIEFQKAKDILQQENKMLLEEVIILRDKSKNKKQGQWSKVLDVGSDVSRDYEQLENYKQIIAEMQTQMLNALKKIQQKDKVIQKLQIRLQKLANSSIINQKNNF